MAPPTRLPLHEQVLAAEVGYCQQCDTTHPTQGDEDMWKRKQDLLITLYPLTGVAPPPFYSPEFKRYLLERHGYSLHKYMAANLNKDAWNCWYLAGALIHPTHK